MTQDSKVLVSRRTLGILIGCERLVTHTCALYELFEDEFWGDEEGLDAVQSEIRALSTKLAEAQHAEEQAAKKVKDTEPPKDYYILDARSCVGNCALWWGPDNKGYVCNVADAGLYTLEDAESHRLSDVPVHRSVVERLVVGHVRWEHLRDAGVDIHGGQSGTRRRLTGVDHGE